MFIPHSQQEISTPAHDFVNTYMSQSYEMFQDCYLDSQLNHVNTHNKFIFVMVDALLFGWCRRIIPFTQIDMMKSS